MVSRMIAYISARKTSPCRVVVSISNESTLTPIMAVFSYRDGTGCLSRLPASQRSGFRRTFKIQKENPILPPRTCGPGCERSSSRDWAKPIHYRRRRLTNSDAWRTRGRASGLHPLPSIGAGRCSNLFPECRREVLRRREPALQRDFTHRALARSQQTLRALDSPQQNELPWRESGGGPKT
jgi:hypothetical protein